jgi:DNA (cytosine-5)-methyltransferase 1
MIGIDIFSGCGGMTVGAKLAGIQVKYAVELNYHCASTYSHNHTDVKMINTDIRKFRVHDLKLSKREPIVLFGGPPCQGFSKSNQKTKNKQNENNWLFKEFIRVAKELKPDWIVFENVGGFSESLEGFFFKETLINFKKMGYATSQFLLNASNYGVPQNRKRVFIVCSLDGITIEEPKATTQKINVGEALYDLPNLKNGAKFSVLPYNQKPHSAYSKAMRGKLEKSTNHFVTQNSEEIIKRYKYVPQGGNWENIPIKLMQNYKDVSRCHSGIYHRLDEAKPSVVIGNYRKNMLIHPKENRGLSVREAARLQSFEDNYIFKGFLTDQQQQVGNAVPPYLAKAVFSEIINNN